MRCKSRWLTLLLTFCLVVALPLQGLAAVSGLPGCPHGAPLQQQTALPPCHQLAEDQAAMAHEAGDASGAVVAADADVADVADVAQGQPCPGCAACPAWAASAPAPAAASLGTVPGPGQAPQHGQGLPAQPGFAQGLERPPRSA